MACVGLWVTALLTKESAAMLPFVLLAYDWFVLDADRAERRRRFARLELPMLAATIGAGVVRIALLMLVEYPGQTGPDWRFALVAVDAFWRYLAMFFVPRGQSIFHAVPVVDSLFSLRAIGGLGGLALLGILIWRLRRVHSLISVGLLWFTLLLVPSSVLFILGRGEPMAEHRAYLSAAGLFLAWGGVFGILWAHTDRRRLLVAVTTVVFLAQLGFQTFIRNVIWHDPVVLSREAASLAPTHWMPRILLAEALRQNGRCSEAATEYRAAIAIRPEDEFPYTETRRLPDSRGAPRRSRGRTATSPRRQSQFPRRVDGTRRFCAPAWPHRRRALAFRAGADYGAQSRPGEADAGVHRGRAARRRARACLRRTADAWRPGDGD